MANGKPFNPDRFTAASWFYPLGTRVKVTLRHHPGRHGRNCAPAPSVIVTITDRGPADRFVQNGRVLDLSHAAFRRLASPELGLIDVEIHALP